MSIQQDKKELRLFHSLERKKYSHNDLYILLYRIYYVIINKRKVVIQRKSKLHEFHHRLKKRRKRENKNQCKHTQTHRETAYTQKKEFI